MAQPQVITFGCRLNAFESEIMRENARSAGLEDTVIVNTCTVTAEADRQARQAIRRARRRNPGAKIIVTGCAAQVHPHAFADMPEVDLVLGNVEKLDPDGFAGLFEGGERAIVSDVMKVRQTATPLIEGFEARTRAFVQIQQGCDYRCTFCIVPFARGPSRSVRPEAVVTQVRRLVERGFSEVVLSGVDISSYGNDLSEQPTLGKLARRLLAEVPALRRLRLSTLDPARRDADLFAALAEEPRLMPHLHLSLQSLDDMVLKRMKRRHTRASAQRFCREARRARPDVVFGADLITGFPTETDHMFTNTLTASEDMDLTFMHVFPFSARPGTPAAHMPQLPVRQRRDRAAVLRAAGEKALARYLEGRVGSLAEVLIEADRRGRSRHYAPVRVAFEAAPGTFVNTRVAGVVEGHLIGNRAA